MATVRVEGLDHHGRVQFREKVDLAGRDAPLTLGRDLSADIVLDDPYVAPVHASLEVGPDGVPVITDLQSLNGIVVEGRRVHGARALPLPQGLVQIGRTRLRIRSSEQAVSPERSDVGVPAGLRPWHAMAAIAICIVIALYRVWLEVPRDFIPYAAMALLSVALVASGWIAVWALLSRVIAGEWRWTAHAAIFFGIVALLFSLGFVVDLGSFALALPRVPLVEMLLLVCCVALALYLHIATASTLRKRTAVLFAVVLPLAIGGTVYGSITRTQSMDVNYIAGRPPLYPPSLQLRPAGSLEAFFADAARLEAEAQDGLQRVEADDEDPDED